jgi:hypothetical protein
MKKMNPTSNNHSRGKALRHWLVLMAASAALASSAWVRAAATCADEKENRASGAERRQGQDGRDGQDRRDGRREERRDGRRDGRRGEPPFEFGWSHRGDDGDLRSPSQNEWDDASAFMRRHSPRRAQAMDQLPEGSWKDKLRKVLFARYRGLRSLERRDPGAFGQRVNQLRLEDEIFGLVSDWAGSAEEERPKLKERLKVLVASLVDLDVQERKRRVERLEAELREQKAALEKDTGQRDALVDDRYNRFLDWANKWAEKRQRDKAKEEEAGRDGKKDGEKNCD